VQEALGSIFGIKINDQIQRETQKKLIKRYNRSMFSGTSFCFTSNLVLYSEYYMGTSRGHHEESHGYPTQYVLFNAGF
jgi:ABC-type phosphate transport system substrate-binding protein